MKIDDSSRSSWKQSIILMVGLLIFGVLSWTIWKGSWKKESSYDVKRAAQRAERLKILREEEQKILTTSDWVDKEAGIGRVPIKRAMKIALEQLPQKPLRKGSVIAAGVSGGTTNDMGTNNVATNNIGTNAAAAVMTTNMPSTNRPSTNRLNTNAPGTNLGGSAERRGLDKEDEKDDLVEQKKETAGVGIDSESNVLNTNRVEQISRSSEERDKEKRTEE